MSEIDKIRARHKAHGKDSIAGLQTRYAWAHKDRAYLLERIAELQAEVMRLKQEQVDFEYNASCIISTEERRAEAAEAKLAKVLEGLEEIRHEASECGSFLWIEGHAEAIIKEARDE